jgi:hypothetical protein
VILILVVGWMGDLRAQEPAGDDAGFVLHIQHSVTTSKSGFPQYLYMYHVLDGADSTAGARALSGNISLENHSANFSEVLWLLAYWEGKCPVDDLSLKGASFIWSDILKNSSQSTSNLRVDLSVSASVADDGLRRFRFRQRTGGGWRSNDVCGSGPDLRAVELRCESRR